MNSYRVSRRARRIPAAGAAAAGLGAGLSRRLNNTYSLRNLSKLFASAAATEFRQIITSTFQVGGDALSKLVSNVDLVLPGEITVIYVVSRGVLFTLFIVNLSSVN